MLRKQPDSLDSMDSASTASSSVSSSYLHPPSSASSSRTHRFRFRSKSPSAARGRSNNGNDSGGSMEAPEQDPLEERAQFTSRGTFNPEKGRQKLHGSRTLQQPAEGSGHHKREPDLSSQQQQQQQQQHLVLYGSNEFMV